MARFSFNDADNYGGNGTNKYFSLKDDKDTAVVRFLYNDMNDIQGVSVHEIEVDGKRVDVECIRAYNEPVSKCPLCEAGYKVNAKLFIPVYDEDSKDTKIWTRGKTFFNKLSSLCSRFNPLVSTPFEIERCGKKGDTNTTYEIYPMKSDDSRIEDFPEINAEEFAFQVKTAEELREYIRTGSFGKKDEIPQRRSVERNSRDVQSAPVRRRPNYDNEESF